MDGDGGAASSIGAAALAEGDATARAALGSSAADGGAATVGALGGGCAEVSDGRRACAMRSPPATANMSITPSTIATTRPAFERGTADEVNEGALTTLGRREGTTLGAATTPWG